MFKSFYRKTLVPLILMGLLSGFSSGTAQISSVRQTDTYKASPSITMLSTTTSYKSDLKVHFIDVGQADCIYVELPNSQKLLIDAGNNEDEATIKKYLASKSVKKLDYFVTTHPHEDHVGAADAVVSSYDIGSIYAPKVSSNTKTFEDFLNAVKKKGPKIKAPEAGSYILNDSNQLSIQVFTPNSAKYDDLNNYSIVLKLKYKNASFLFTGDAEVASENEMLAKKYDLKANVLKVGHHGSTSSTSSAFLSKVNPQSAVISVGRGNDYGHPAQGTLSKLIKANVQVYRTDEAGTIVFTSDGSKITIDKKASAIKENAPPVKTMVYIGNKNTKKFHLETCRSLPAPENRVYYKSRDEAIKAGYIVCKICNP
jgi:competence protein ComEC